MPDLEISRLPQLAGADLQGTDPIAIADISASETKKLTVADLATFGIQFISNDSISGDQIISLDGGKLLPNSVTAREIAPNAVGSSELADLSVDTAAIQDGAVTNVKLASGIDGGKILALSIGNAQIIDLDGSKILSGTISTDQLGADCITAVQLANNSVDTAAVQNGAITNDKLAVNIDGSKILANSITSLELAPNSVGSSELADSSVDTAAIQSAAVTDAKLASGISGSKITDGSLSDAKISSLDGAKLFGNSVTANEIAPNSIGSSELSDASVDTAAVQDGAITDDKLASGIDGGKISSASITNVQLGPGSVTNPAIRDGAVTDAKITGPIDASKLSNGSIPGTALGNVTDRGLDQSTGKIGITNLVTAGTQSGISWDEKGLITGASGSVPSGDLPVATDATTGVVSVPSEGGLAVDAAGALSIANAITAATKQGITYDKHGSIINVSDTIPVASIPLATNSTIGGVKVPGPDVTVSSDGALTLGDSGVTAGTYPKVTVNSKGVVTAGTSLAASDIPDLDADKITSGNLDGSFIADRSVQQIKLADNSTCYIQEARPSISPGSNYKGCLWYQESTAQLRIWNGNSWNAVGFGRLSQDNLRWGGIINATTGLVVTLTDAGQTAQLIVGAALPEASDALGGLYMVTDPGGNGIGVTAGITYDAGDWVLCINAAEGWTRIDTMASGGGGGGASSLDQLVDVSITDAANGEILVYNDSNGQWENEPQAVESVSSVFGRTGDVVATNGDYDLGELGDVDLTSVPAATGDVLQYDGAEWTPVNLAGTVPITSVVAGSGLTDSGSGTDVVLDVGAGTGITVNADDIEINRTVVDSWYIDVSGDTMTGPLVLSGDPTANPQAANKKYVDDVAAAAVISGDAKYVKVAGSNMTGDLTLGTDKITLKATDGSITAANTITSGAYDASDALAGGSRLLSGGRIDIQRASTETSTSALIQGYYGTDRTLAVRADGSSEFAGDMAIGITGSFTPSTPAISLNADGSGTFESQVQIGDNASLASRPAGTVIRDFGLFQVSGGASDNVLFVGYEPGVNSPRVIFDNQGEGKFAGTVSIGGVMPAGAIAAAPNITLNADGDAKFSGDVQIGQSTGAQNLKFVRAITGVSNGLGSVEFANASQVVCTVAGLTDGTNIGAITINTSTTSGAAPTEKARFRPNGDLEMGGTVGSNPNISLMGADGSATFAGGVVGLKFSGGVLDLPNSSFAFRINAYGDNDEKVFSVDRSGNTKIGGTLPSAPNIELNADGSGVFEGQVTAGSPTGTTNSYVRIYSTGGITHYTTSNDAVDYTLIGRSDYSGTPHKTSYAFRADGGLNIGGDINNTLSASPNITLSADGTISATGLIYGTQVRLSTATTLPNNYSPLVAQESGQVLSIQGSSFKVSTGGSSSTPTTEAFTIDGGGTAKFAGDVKIGGTLPSAPAISLNASDGSATFAGNVVNGDWAANGKGCCLNSIGVLQSRRSSGDLFQGYDTDGKTSSIASDGSGTFAGGNFEITTSGAYVSRAGGGNNNVISTNLGNNGTVGPVQYFTSATAVAGSKAIIIREQNATSDGNIELNYDGTATFAGTVTAGGFDIDALPSLP